MRSRPYTWLQTHIVGLITRPRSRDAAGMPVNQSRVQVLYFARADEAAAEQLNAAQ